MKRPALIETENNTYRFKLRYSTLCDLKSMGVDLLTEEGAEDMKKDPTKLRTVFWKGLEAGEMKKFKQEEAFDIFDDVMEEIGPEKFAEIIPQSLAIKQQPPTGK
jgi:hypothetical protein